MALVAAIRNSMLSTFTAAALYGSLHSADPSTTGASEISGGSPAYARLALSWGSPSGGSVSASAVTFNVAAGTTVAYYGFWSALTGGTWYGGYAVTTSETYGGQGTFTLTPTETLT